MEGNSTLAGVISAAVIVAGVIKDPAGLIGVQGVDALIVKVRIAPTGGEVGVIQLIGTIFAAETVPAIKGAFASSAILAKVLIRVIVVVVDDCFSTRALAEATGAKAASADSVPTKAASSAMAKAMQDGLNSLEGQRSGSDAGCRGRCGPQEARST